MTNEFLLEENTNRTKVIHFRTQIEEKTYIGNAFPQVEV